MKPNFALDLTHEGIGLLHRGRSGWLFVGEVGLDDPDLGGALALLRKTAAGLASGGLSTKLLIPESQILYTDVHAPGLDLAARRMQITDALVGRTPYAVEDLAFDWSGEGPTVQVAVVARETLAEAEAFAAEHRFNPICFATSPPDGAFTGEPFFGETRFAAGFLEGAEVERDTATQIVTGRADIDALDPIEPMPSGDAAADTADASDDFGGALQDTDPAAHAPEAHAAEAPMAQDVSDELLSTFDATLPEEHSEEPIPAFSTRRGPEALPKDDPIAPTGETSAPPSAPEPIGDIADAGARLGPISDEASVATGTPQEPPVVGFSSRRGRNGASSRAEPTIAQPRPPVEVQVADDDSALPPPPKPVMRAPAPMADAVAPPPASDTQPNAPQLRATPRGDAHPGTPIGVAPDPVGFEAPPLHDAQSEPAAATGARLGLQTQKILGAGKAVGAGLGETMRKRLNAARNRQRSAASQPDPQAEAMTVFGARSNQRTRSGRLGLLLTLLLVVFLIAVAIWSSLFLSDSVARFFSSPRGAVETAAATSQPGDATGVQAALPVAPELGEQAELSVPDFPTVSGTDEAVELASLSDPSSAELSDFEPELPETTTTGPPPDELIDVRPPTPAEAREAYLATGIWQLAPVQAPVPDEIEIANIYVASIDPRVTSQDAIALPAPGAARTDERPLPVVTPLPFDTRFDYDDRGFVRATPDGALTPEGAIVIAGRPATLPLLRPTTNLPVVTNEELAAVRPLRRPTDFADTVERGTLGGLTRSELASIKPLRRPQSAQELAVQDSGADEAPTKLAVASTGMPRTRPGNFASTVEKARAAGIKPQADPARSAPSSPAIPTRASVAKQATQNNVISLKKVTLIGVYGSPSSRRAMVRLPSGRYVKVEVGDRVDGGKVAAIDKNSLRYTKGGRSILLKMPKG